MALQGAAPERGRVVSYISINPRVQSGWPCVSGTRVTVQAVVRMWAVSKTSSGILEAYINLTEHDILVALWYWGMHGHDKRAKALRSWARAHEGAMWADRWDAVPWPAAPESPHA